MKKLMRLLAMTLAAAMLLSVGAFAAENESGPRLVWSWLDWNDEGAFVSNDTLAGRNYEDEELHMAPGGDFAIIFFTVGENGARTPVIPTAGKNVTIEKLAKEEIASGAKQSDYYVHVRVDDWGETEITSGKSTMKVVGELPDVGYYTTPEATQKSYLRDDQQPMDPSQLKDNTVYFVRGVSDDPNQRQITDVKKNGNGSSSMYDLEKVNDNAWKITLKIPEDGGAWVNLDITFQEPDGRTYTEERGYGFEYPRGPELMHSWVDRNEEVGLFLPEDHGVGGDINIVPGDEFDLIFFTCDRDDKGEETFTPVSFNKLKASKGFNLTSLKDESSDKLADCFVRVTVDGWNLNGTISCGDYTLKVTSNLPDIGIYSKPELSTDNFLRTWRFAPLTPYETVYVGSYIPEGDDRVLADLKLAKFENSDQFTLEKYNDQFYKLTRKTLNISYGDVVFDTTWKWPGGHTEEWQNSIWMEPTGNVLISEKPLPADALENMVFYDDVKDSVSNSITLKTGETKTVYLTHTFFRDMWGKWRVLAAAPMDYAASGSLKLEVAPAEGYPPKYTISCNTPGTYQIGLVGWEWFAYDKDGKEIADDLAEQFIYPDYDFETGEWTLFDYSGEEPVPYAFDGRLEFKQYEEIESDWYSTVTVTVTGEAAKPAETTTGFPDVKASAWYAPAVAFASTNGYMNGNADGTFNPDGQVKGSEFAQILYNKEGKPAAADGASFNGVTDQWYAPAILWAAGKGIITDTGDTAVAPTANLTRQRIALMLYNYMGKPAADADLSKFSDADKISDWALDAVKWAVSEGILKGNADGTFNPAGTAKRSETAQILMNFFG